MINPEIYSKALKLREKLLKEFNGAHADLVICYTLVEAIEIIKEELLNDIKTARLNPSIKTDT